MGLSFLIHVIEKSIREEGTQLPSSGEQEAIAEMLADMDAEIEALEVRRDKIQALKQGMMQELLTGRTAAGMRCTLNEGLAYFSFGP